MRIRSLVNRLRGKRTFQGPEEQRNAEAKVGEIRDIKPSHQAIIAQVNGLTLTGTLRLESLLQSVEHCIARDIPGSFVECGVWKGGSVLAMILQLQELGVTDRHIYLYDTFDGMTEPTEEDTSVYEAPALDTWQKASERGDTAWGRFFDEEVFCLDGVRAVLEATGYPQEFIHIVQGKVEETIPETIPDDVALLRLDTDWYASTRHELIHLYPRVPTGGVLIIDDYGHWDGARKAVDEYFLETGCPLLLHRIDYSGRVALKL